MEIFWAPTCEPKELLNEWKSLKRSVSEYESQVQAPKDTSYDNLERQGFDLHPDPLNTGKQHTEIQSDKKLSLICSLQTQNWIFHQLGNAKSRSERSTKLPKSSWQGQKPTALIQKFLIALQTMPHFLKSQILQGLVYTPLMENVLVC